MLYVGFCWLYGFLVLLSPQIKDTTAYHVRTEEIWIFDHYEPVKGKIIGIWPRHERYETPAEIRKLRYKYGFNYVLLPSSLYRNTFNLLLNNGYSREYIMAQIFPDNHKRKIEYYGRIYGYYLDEPNERGFSISGIKEEIDKSAAGSGFFISGYRRTSGLASMVIASDGVMFSSYKHWWQCFPGVWCAWPEEDDQSDDWSDMKERYGSKSFMNWIGAHEDSLEYSSLLKHSSKLKLKGVWLYQYHEMTNSESNILKFCSGAWINGYLNKFERKIVYEYRCYKNNLKDCGPENWQVFKKLTTEEIREVKN